MGRGVISQDKGKGLYDLNLDYGTTIRDQRLATLNARKADLDAEVIEAEALQDILDQNEAAALLEIDNKINAYNANETEDNKEAITEAVAAHVLTVEKQREGKTRLSILKLNRLNVETEIAALNALNLTETKEVWCAEIP